MPASSHCLCTRLRRAGQTMLARYDAALAQSGVTTPQFALLRHLRRIGPCRITDLAEATGHDRTTLTRTLAPLERMGLVESRAGEDRRSRLLALSESGAAILARAEPAWESAQAQAQARLGPDLPAFLSLLEKLEA